MEVRFVSITSKDQTAQHVISLETLPGLYGTVVIYRMVVIYDALKNEKEMGSTEHLGCNIEAFKK